MATIPAYQLQSGSDEPRAGAVLVDELLPDVPAVLTAVVFGSPPISGDPNPPATGYPTSG